jgi:putative transcriptional regulator
VKIDWTKVAAVTECEIARQAVKDGTSPPSERAWQRMVRERRVRVVPPRAVDVRRIREKLALSQVEFAERFGFTASAVRQWEQGRRQPHGPARVLLTLIDREPNAVSRALMAAE